MRRAAALGLCVLLLAACAPVPQVKRATRLYMPVVANTPIKLGLGVQWRDTLESVRTLGGTWVYNWSTVGHSAPGYEFVPMVYGRFDALPLLPDGTTHALLFNEPDLAQQANLSPVEAARLANELFTAYPGVEWGAPAAFDGAWLDAWEEAYKGMFGRYPPVAFLTVHCYRWSAAGCITLAEQYYRRLARYGVTGGVWVTEFAFTDEKCKGNGRHEAETFTAWLEAQPWVVRYAPFVAYQSCDWDLWDCRTHGNPSLFEADRQTLTEVGGWYARSLE